MSDAMEPHDSFAALVERGKHGDTEAVESLLLRVEAQLKRSVSLKLGEQLRANVRHSDVLQNVYVEMLRCLPQFEGTSEPEFVSWLTSIIEHDIQRQRRWFGAQKRKGPERTSEKNRLAEVLQRPTPTPSAEAAFGEERDRIDRALEELSTEHREVLDLAVFQELPHKEVAARMGRSESAARMLLHRARTALGLALERHRSPDGDGTVS